MDERPVILQIRNNHTAACGTPPYVEGLLGQYVGYFENEHGEQMIFVFDRQGKTGCLYAGDAHWETTYKVVDGVVPGMILSSMEGQWLRACWMAVTAWDT